MTEKPYTAFPNQWDITEKAFPKNRWDRHTCPHTLTGESSWTPKTQPNSSRGTVGVVFVIQFGVPRIEVINLYLSHHHFCIFDADLDLDLYLVSESKSKYKSKPIQDKMMMMWQVQVSYLFVPKVELNTKKLNQTAAQSCRYGWDFGVQLDAPASIWASMPVLHDTVFSKQWDIANNSFPVNRTQNANTRYAI